MEKFVPVVVIKDMSEVDKILPALKANGINCAEITFRTACAKEAIKYASTKYTDMLIGAGTVINKAQCKDALEAGAKFIVSPGLSVDVAKLCKKKNIPYYPGCVLKCSDQLTEGLHVNLAEHRVSSRSSGRSGSSSLCLMSTNLGFSFVLVSNQCFLRRFDLRHSVRKFGAVKDFDLAGDLDDFLGELVELFLSHF